jgi:hypothetical protein
MLILGPIAILLVFALALAWRHPREGTDIVGKSVSEESDANKMVKRHDRWRGRRRR